MMKENRWRIALGGGLILLGLLALLDTLTVFDTGSVVWGLFFLVLSGIFLYVLVSNHRGNWWAAIPGFTLLGIALLFFVDLLFPRLADLVGGFLVTGFIGLAFLVVYLINRSFWWAIIPAGVMLSVAGMILIEPFVRFDVAWIFLLGLAATFGVVSLMTSEGHRMTWALWPAGVLTIIALLIMVDSLDMAGYIFPILMIVGGGVLVWRALSRRSSLPPSV